LRRKPLRLRYSPRFPAPVWRLGHAGAIPYLIEFLRGQREVAQAFALPSSISGLGVRRYGFHGLSYEYIASVFAQFDQEAASGRTIVAHLGNRSSMCAMMDGKSVASTMGFTAVDFCAGGVRSHLEIAL
jgi:acetate kinase